MGHLIHTHDTAWDVAADGLDAAIAHQRRKIAIHAHTYSHLFGFAESVKHTPAAGSALDYLLSEPQHPSAARSNRAESDSVFKCLSDIVGSFARRHISGSVTPHMIDHDRSERVRGLRRGTDIGIRH